MSRILRTLLVFILLDVFAKVEGLQHKYTIIELRHDCSTQNATQKIVRQLWTTVVFRLREPIYQSCKNDHDSVIRDFKWEFRKIPRNPCRAIVGCHALESRVDPVLSSKVYDFRVNAFFREGNTSDQMIEINNRHKRHFWNLTGSETVGLDLRYKSGLEFDQDRRFPRIMCFAWCNPDFLDSAPLRASLSQLDHDHPEDEETLSYLRSAAAVTVTSENTDIFTSPKTIYHLSSQSINGFQCHNQICSLKFTFEWLNPEAVCSSNFVCTDLSNGACRNYGLRFIHATREGMSVGNQSVCISDRIYSGTIGVGQSASIEIWHSENHSSFTADCYFWCTSDGSVPMASNSGSNATIVNQTLANLERYNNLLQRYPVSLGLTEEREVTLSPVIVYHIDVQAGNSSSLGQDQDICWSKVTFKMTRQRSCQLKLLCSGLTGNVCGDYGVIAAHVAANRTTFQTASLCEERFEFSPNHRIRRYDRLDLELWHHHAGVGAPLPENVTCFLWCSNDGSVPTLKLRNTGSQLTGWNRSNYDIVPVAAGISLSHHRVYTFKEAFASLASCQGKPRCITTYSMRWNHLKACRASVECPRLEGNICGDFAFGAVFRNRYLGTRAMSFCQSNRTYNGILQPGGSIVIYASFEPDAQFLADCYFWCSRNGSLPINPRPRAVDLAESLAPEELFPSNSTWLTLSPLKTYHIASNQSLVPACQFQALCWINFKLMWAPPSDQCHLKIHCSHLDPHFCGDNGFQVQLEHSSKELEICHSNVTYLIGTLESMHTANLSFWYASGSSFEMDCFLWCDTDLSYNLDFRQLDHVDTLEDISLASVPKMPLIFRNATYMTRISDKFVYEIEQDFTNESSACHSGELCDKVMTLVWSSPTICQARLICDNLSQGVCVDHGINIYLDIDEQPQPICMENYTLETNMNPRGKTLTLSLWHLRNVSFSIHCYFWCSTTGLIPVIDFGRNSSQARLLLSFNDTTPLLSGNKSTAGLSQYFMYTLLFTGSSDICKTGTKPKCWRNQTLMVHHTDQCEMKFNCPELKGNVCSDYGLLLSSPESVLDYCYENVTQSMTLLNRSSIQLSMWSYSRSTFDIKCYLWCTPSGSVPSPYSNPVDNATVMNIDNLQIEKVVFGNPVPVSPVKTYELRPTNAEDNQSNIQLRWHWDQPCNAIFYCDSFVGEGCGEHGFTLSLMNQSLKACFQNQVIDFLLEDNVKITYWKTNYTTYPPPRCYFFCRNHLRPILKNGSSVDYKLLMELSRRTKHLTEMEHVHQHNMSLGLSPVRLYHLNTSNHESLVCPRTTKCLHDYVFHWHGDEPCQLNLICSYLGKGACADHGFTLMTDNVTRFQICHPDEIYETNVTMLSSVNAELWTVQGASVNLSCYLWCRDLKGQYSASHNFNVSMIEQFKDTLKTEVVNLFDLIPRSVQPLSMNKIYKILINEAVMVGNHCENHRKCNVTHHYQWMGPKPVNITMVCDEIDGNICGDFGINLIPTNGTGVPVCHQGKDYNLTLTSLDQVQLQYWHTEDVGNSFQMSCYFWIAQPGVSTSFDPDPLSRRLDGSLTRINTKNATVIQWNSNGTFPLHANMDFMINNSWTDESMACQQRLCIKESKLAWLGLGTCQLTFYCQYLGGDVCADYGIELSTTSSNLSICQAGRHYKMKLNTHDVLRIIFWYASSSYLNMSCFLWCNNQSGNLFDTDIVTVPMDFKTLHIDDSDIRLRSNHSVSRPFGRKYNFHWKGSDVCKAAFTCDKLAGNICEEYGIQVQLDDDPDPDPVCLEESVHLGSIEPNGSAIIGVWFKTILNDTINVDANCYLWCANNMTTFTTKGRLLPSGSEVKYLTGNSTTIRPGTTLKFESPITVISVGIDPVCKKVHLQCPSWIQSEDADIVPCPLKIAFHVLDMEIWENVCSKNQVYSQDLPSNSESSDLSMTIYNFTQSYDTVNLRLQCGIWCTDFG